MVIGKTGCFEIVSKGADLKVVNNRGCTPLQSAVRWGHKGVAHLLVAKGAQEDVFAAAGLGDLKRLEALLKDAPKLAGAKMKDGWTALHFAAGCDQVEAVKFLLEKGAALDATDINGIPARQVAETTNSKSVAAYLKKMEEAAEKGKAGGGKE